MGFGVTELLIILGIVLLLFGGSKLKNLGGDLGGAIKGFRKAMTKDDAAKSDADVDAGSETSEQPPADDDKPSGH